MSGRVNGSGLLVPARIAAERNAATGDTMGCASHREDVAREVKHRGFWSYVRPEKAASFAVHWLRGTATKEALDPYVIALLEIRAKAERMGLKHHSRRCPLCAIAVIAKDAEAPGKVVVGSVDLAVNVMTTNGHKAR